MHLGASVLHGGVGACVWEGIRALRAGCISSPKPKPASGLGDTASMLSPKGNHDREVDGAQDLRQGKGMMGRGGLSATLGQAGPDSRRASFQDNTGVPRDTGRYKRDCVSWNEKL